MNVLILEDEPAQLADLTEFCKKEFPEFEVQGVSSLKTAEKILNSGDFDLAILDIMIKGVSVFNALRNAPLNGKQLLFITGNQNFAIKAFEFYAVDYIIKPYSKKRLKESIEIAIHRRRRGKDLKQVNQYKHLLEDMSRSAIESIALPVSNGQILVKLKEIIAIKAERSYCVIYTTSQGNIIISKPLAWIDNLLTPEGFFRVHRSWMINPRHVKQFIKQQGNSLSLTGELIVAITNRSKNQLMDWFKHTTLFG
jgi:two-component system LytT family response regulator